MVATPGGQMNPRDQFCPNTDCPARGKSGENNLVVHSRKEARYKCTVCDKTFAESTGTPFYRLHHDPELFTRVITLLAFGCPPQAIVAAFGLDERTVAEWQERSGQHCQQVHAHLVEKPRDLVHVQMDEIGAKQRWDFLSSSIEISWATALSLQGRVSNGRDER